jgi:hypothetical protein
MRPYPKGFKEFYSEAKAMGLSYPIGRALYACNRKRNGWPQDRDSWAGMGLRLVPDFLRRMKESTAKRWQIHWRSGGHIQALRSVEEQNRIRRIRDQRVRDQRRRQCMSHDGQLDLMDLRGQGRAD